MLSLKQIAEGRDLEDIACSAFADDADRAARSAWLVEHVDELLDAAERVAQQEAYAAEPDGYDEPLTYTSAAFIIAAAGELAEAERARARLRFAELQPALVEEFQTRPLVSDALAETSANPRAFAPKHVKAWLRAYGLEATVVINPNNPRDLLVDPLRCR